MSGSVKDGDVSTMSRLSDHKYHKFIGSSGRIWLVADSPDCVDHIYHSSHPRASGHGFHGSAGFGGAVIRFELVDGEAIDIQGPWHSNPESFYHDTGIDIKDVRRLI